jgi:NAD(P)H-quinone oxidoreductase subunit 5
MSVTTNLHQLWPCWNASVLCIPMMLYILGGFCGQLASVKRIGIGSAWRAARIASITSLLFALACCSIAILHATSLVRAPRVDSLARFGVWHLSFRFDLIESLMLLLVSFLGWVIVSYSRAYMAGDPREPSYVAQLMLTLASVSLLVVTNSLVLFLAAWVLTGFSLHGLLTLYPNRQAAVIAAHKKFLASRLGDLTLLCAVILLGRDMGGFEIDEIAGQFSRPHPVSASIQVAAILLAISAIIKCAQLPLHGWLIQVMEAPTPVSALLHAGVVNLGGFMLIRLAPVIDTTPAAHGLLTVVGCLTATIASLVMTTRISVKVNLAWSTCAQMGFMLMECGLGLYGLAFLHLLAHSLYKAHAFLGSGDTVNHAKLKRMMPSTPNAGFPTLLISGMSGLLLAALAALLLRTSGLNGALGLFCVPVVGMAIAGILSGAISMRSLTSSVILLTAAIGIDVIYFGFDRLFQELLPMPRYSLAPQRPLLVICVICFVVLYGIQMIVRLKPMGALASALYPWLYAGLYLDEVFTRATFRLWPAHRVPKVAPLRDATQPFDASGVKI